MNLFVSQTELRDVKAKDAVLRYLYAFDARIFKDNEDEKAKLTLFRKNSEYEPKKGEKELENAIRNVNENSDYAYAAAILEGLLKFDYVDRKPVANDNNLVLYGLTRTGSLFVSTSGFEKELTEKRHLVNENFYKWLTLLVALIAIALPVLYDSTNDLVKPMHEIKVSLDSINQNLKSLQPTVPVNAEKDTTKSK